MSESEVKIKGLKLVTQPIEEPGCGVACTAMLAGVTYSAAARQFEPGFEIGGTTKKQVHRAAKRMGVKISKTNVNLAGNNSSKKLILLEKLESHALLSNHEKGGASDHWLVSDGVKKVVLDPSRERRDNIKNQIGQLAYAFPARRV